MREFDLVFEHPAGKENLFADALSSKHICSLDPTKEQGFIAQSIDPTNDNTEPQDTSITTNNLWISPIPDEITMVSHRSISLKHTDCDYNKWPGHDESLGHHPSCSYLDDGNDRDYENYDDIMEVEMQSDTDTLSTIPEVILDGYEFHLHPHLVEQDQLNGCYHISAPADDKSSFCNNDNIPTIIIDIINDAWENYKPDRKQHNTDCHDYYCDSYSSSNQNGNRYFPTTRSSVCGTYGYGCLDCTLVVPGYQKEKEFQ